MADFNNKCKKVSLLLKRDDNRIRSNCEKLKKSEPVCVKKMKRVLK